MPSVQRGQVRKVGRGYAARFYDEDGTRRQQGGFQTRSAAVAFLNVKVGEVAALRRGDPSAIRRRSMPTLADLADEYLGVHTGEANTKRTLQARIDYATRKFGDVPLDRLDVTQLTRWRSTLPERSAWAIVKALRQVLNYGVRVGLLADNPARHVPNPEPKRREVPTFATIAELEAVAAELPAEYRALPILAGLTGLRPEEWIALERGDIDRAAGLLHVRRVYTDGQVKAYGKQAGSLRAVPLPTRALLTLSEHTFRVDTRLVFPGGRGGFLNLNEFRRDIWTPAIRAAGLEHRTPYALRHTYASLSIAAGVSLFELSRFMGTSAEQIDKTYGHLLPDSHERARTALDSFLAAEPIEAVQ